MKEELGGRGKLIKNLVLTEERLQIDPTEKMKSNLQHSWLHFEGRDLTSVLLA